MEMGNLDISIGAKANAKANGSGFEDGLCIACNWPKPNRGLANLNFEAGPFRQVSIFAKLLSKASTFRSFFNHLTIYIPHYYGEEKDDS